MPGQIVNARAPRKPISVILERPEQVYIKPHRTAPKKKGKPKALGTQGLQFRLVRFVPFHQKKRPQKPKMILTPIAAFPNVESPASWGAWSFRPS